MALTEAILTRVRQHLSDAEHNLNIREFDKAYESAEQAIKLAQEQDHTASLAAAYYGMAAVIWGSGGSSEDSHRYATLAAQNCKADTETDLLVRTLVARLKAARGNYDAAIVLNEHLLKFYTENADLRGRADVLRSLGGVFAMQGKYERAREHYLESLHIYQTLNDPLNHAGLLLSLGSMMYQMDHDDEAREYWQQARTIAEANGFRHVLEAAEEGLALL